MRAGLRVSHTGQRFPHAQAGHQDAEEGPGATGVGDQDVQSHQEGHTSRAQGPVRREKRMRRVETGRARCILHCIPRDRNVVHNNII